MMSRKLVEQLAQAVRLKLTDEELPDLGAELQQMLEQVRRLAAVDVTDVPEWTPPASAGHPLRPDEPRPSLARGVALSLSPAAAAGAQAGFFRVPRTLDDA